MQEMKGQPPQLQNAGLVHRRGLALAYLTCRALIDADPNPRAREMSEKILFFVNGVGLTSDLLPHEMRLLKAPFGSLNETECAATSWLSEGMVLLAWAIGHAELPDFRTKCHPGPAAINLGMFRPGTKDRLAQATLRDPMEIEMKALTYLALNWRIGHFLLNPAEKIDFAARLKDPQSPHLLVDEVELLDGDMAIDGVPLVEVPHQRAGEVAFIVRERFNALQWLQGYAEHYSTEATVQ